MFVTVDLYDPNNEPLELELSWSTSDNQRGTNLYENLSNGESRLLLGRFDFGFRGDTFFVTMTLKDPTERIANRGFQLSGSLGGGNCPSVFG